MRRGSLIANRHPVALRWMPLLGGDVPVIFTVRVSGVFADDGDESFIDESGEAATQGARSESYGGGELGGGEAGIGGGGL